jgi:DNA polymerase-4
MRIACVFLPNFYFQIERLRVPDLEDRPVIIGGSPGLENNEAIPMCGDNAQDKYPCPAPKRSDKVADCSEEAAALGILPGMSLREAYYRCPDALFLPFSGRYSTAWENILFALSAFSLRLEPEIPGLVYLDITKTIKIYRNERDFALAVIQEMAESSHLKARIGIANSRFIAKQAALRAWDAAIIAPGEERSFLSLLPVETLPFDEKEKDHLRLLGLHTLKRVAGLSQKALISQFGAMGTILFEIVNGTDEKKPILRRQIPLCLEREFTSETPLLTSIEVRAVMEKMVAGLSDELAHMGMVSRKISVILWLGNRHSVEKCLIMKKPSAEAKHILGRVSDFLESLSLENPIASFRIALPDPIPSEGDQADLFRRKSVFAERLENIKSYFNARYGYMPLMKIEEGERHSRLPERRFRFADI